jgi:hypothetical protein
MLYKGVRGGQFEQHTLFFIAPPTTLHAHLYGTPPPLLIIPLSLVHSGSSLVCT